MVKLSINVYYYYYFYCIHEDKMYALEAKDVSGMMTLDLPKLLSHMWMGGIQFNPVITQI